MKTGRPTIWTNDKKNISLKLAEQGKTDKEICEIIGISESSFTDQKRKDKDFLRSLKVAKESFDSEIVENALLKRAIGMSLKEVTIRTVDGKQIKTETVKEIAPDSAALALYLRNRMPEKYNKEKQGLTIGFEDHLNMSFEDARQIFKDDPFLS